jgi:hypothetical protein
MEIRDYKKGDEIAILGLFELAFGNKMSIEYWRWRFEDNPFGNHLIKLMWADNKLIGHYAVSPVNLILKGKIVKSALSMTTMTHPDYGGQGVFGKLANALYESIHQKEGINYVWGFPNSNSHYAFIKKLNWQDVGVVHELEFLRDKMSQLTKDNQKIVLLDTVSSIDLALIKNDLSGVKVNRTVEYMKWRFDDNPSQDYKTAILYNEKGEQLIALIFKNYNKGGNDIINIMDVFGEINITCLGQLFQELFNVYTKAQTLTIWFSLWNKDYQELEKIGFSPSGKITYLGLRENVPTKMDLLNFRNWNLSFSDSDVY